VKDLVLCLVGHLVLHSLEHRLRRPRHLCQDYKYNHDTERTISTIA
jgi:hypothetical protein